MAWTKEIPTEKGYYWLRYPTGWNNPLKPAPVEVTNAGEDCFMCYGIGSEDYWCEREIPQAAEWFGPIVAPE